MHSYVKAALVASIAVAATVATGPTAQPSYAAEQDAGILQVMVDEVHSNRGHIRVAVCTADTFLTTNCPFHGSAPAQPGNVAVTINGVPPGTYAVQVFHDEDDSRHIKRTLFGIPEEGVGFSNDAPTPFGPPRFANAAFRLTPQGGRIGLHLRYFD